MPSRKNHSSNPKSITSSFNGIPAPTMGTVVNASAGSGHVIRDGDANIHQNVPIINGGAGGQRVVVGYVNNSNQPIAFSPGDLYYATSFYGESNDDWPRIMQNDTRNPSAVGLSGDTGSPSVFTTNIKSIDSQMFLADGYIYTHFFTPSSYDGSPMYTYSLTVNWPSLLFSYWQVSYHFKRYNIDIYNNNEIQILEEYDFSYRSYTPPPVGAGNGTYQVGATLYHVYSGYNANEVKLSTGLSTTIDQIDGPPKAFSVAAEGVQCIDAASGNLIWSLPIRPSASLVADTGEGYRWYGYDTVTRTLQCIEYDSKEEEPKVIWQV